MKERACLYADCIDLLEAYEHDPDLAGAALLGRDVRRDVAQEAWGQVSDVFADDRKRRRFISQMMQSNPGDIDIATLFLDAFLQALRQ